jgi:uncharacterized protein (TIGR02598 family)
MNALSSSPGSLAKCRGFTLVEVCLSLGIMAFSVTAMLGLLPLGVDTLRKNIDSSQAKNLSQQVVLEARQMAFSTLSTMGAYKRYFNSQGDSVNAGSAQMVYTCNVSVNGNGVTKLPGGDTQQRTLVTLTVEIRKTPGGVDLPQNSAIANTVSMVSCQDLSSLGN